jgi:hypothetical protein
VLRGHLCFDVGEIFAGRKGTGGGQKNGEDREEADESGVKIHGMPSREMASAATLNPIARR